MYNYFNYGKSDHILYFYIQIFWNEAQYGLFTTFFKERLRGYSFSKFEVVTVDMKYVILCTIACGVSN